jgi:multidrug efflux pump subunit AcrA (membrane-fusion protein)
MILLLLSACAPPPGGQKKEDNAAAKSIVYSTARAAIREVPAYIQATGSFIAEESSDVAPAVGGRVAATPVEIGDFVKKGQIICRLEDRDAQLRLDQARAGLEQAGSCCARRNRVSGSRAAAGLIRSGSRSGRRARGLPVGDGIGQACGSGCQTL